ncbi:acyl-homoserine-lactone synthase [Bradyrhizobium sp. NBAIM01]|uniref:acyl-homoserine-lactone synthase n=1 Tax=Bradyrhizobium sp. NBAIM01 TaxID=2793818 RepID=UPI001CD5901E|nr:acyl-homoserine-lactone synthase [Bradyrhizobium sp. NBAIM01]MCA1510547.1 GNAT family N-acetyltransferase [Bradyrhizobium sp. NBAIM01]
MIEAFSFANAHHFQDALASQARLRYEVFVERRGLPHSFWEGLEFDEFDTPAAKYLVWRDEKRVVRGLARLLPTTNSYMLQTYWPHLISGRIFPSSSGVWELTRVCVDKSLDSKLRRTVLPELLCAIEEFLSTPHGVGIVGVTREHLLTHFIRSGIRWLGEPDLIEGELERAFFVPKGFIRPEHHCRRFGIARQVLANPEGIALAPKAA